MTHREIENTEFYANLDAESKAMLDAANAEMDVKLAEMEAEYKAKSKKRIAEWEAKWRAEDPEYDAKWAAEAARWNAVTKGRKIENKQEDGLYNDITGQRIPYMNDEGDHIDYDHGWYD
jgi:hypothetical protein